MPANQTPTPVSLRPWKVTQDGSRIRAALLRPGMKHLEPPGLASPGDELLLVVQLRPKACERERELRVDLYRGDERRDTQRRLVSAGSATPLDLYLRLTSSVTPGRSARLTCRVHFDGWEIARPGVLLSAAAEDAQGRFAPGTDAPATPATLLAFADLFAEQFGRGPVGS